MLVQHAQGHYRFMTGIAPYSCGVVADPGYEVVHVTLQRSVDWRPGFAWIEDYLGNAGVSCTSLCAVQLRCPAPYTMSAFIEFNAEYTLVLRDWNVYVGELNPIARTNVAPCHAPPATPQLFAFSYVRPAPQCRRPTFIVAGAGELREGTLDAEQIVRRGELSGDALREKGAFVVRVMTTRLTTLGVDWSHVNHVNLYSMHPLDDVIRHAIVPQIGSAIGHGLHCHATRPPVREIELEMDVRGVATEYWLDPS